MKNAVFWNVTPCDFFRTDVSEERTDSIIRVKKISELRITLAVTSDTFLRNVCSYKSRTASHPRRRKSAISLLICNVESPSRGAAGVWWAQAAIPTAAPQTKSARAMLGCRLRLWPFPTQATLAPYVCPAR
jgi:hypothetical protein